MKKSILLFSLLCFCFFTKAQFAIRADSLFTVAGPMISRGVVLVCDGKIEAVGREDTMKIPAYYKQYQAKVVTPGLIDARTVVGLSGAMNLSTDQDQLEKSSTNQPDLRALDAYNPEEVLVKRVREMGTTTIHTGHGIGALISGQTMIAKTKLGTADEVAIRPLAMIAMTIGPTVYNNFSSPGTKAKQIAMLRDELSNAQSGAKYVDSNEIEANIQPMQLLMLGKIKGLICANTSVDIMSAIRLANEFKFKLVIEGAAEAYLLTDEIKASGAEVILHPTMARNSGEMLNMNRESAIILTKAGIPVSIESGYEAYVPKTRIILLEAGAAVAYGFPFEEALKSITMNPAKLLGIEDRVGSIEVGKDADLVLYNGDPFEYTSNVCVVFIDGVPVSEICN